MHAETNLYTAVITLNPEGDIVKELQQHLADEHIELTLATAVDGRQYMPELAPGEIISQRKAILNRKAQLSSSEVGCYLSHYRLVRTAYESGYSHICIFEDDVIAERGIGNVIREITSLPQKYHLVRLMSLKMRSRKIIKRLTPLFTLVRPIRGALGTQGYILNREGMKIVLQHGMPIAMPIDKFYDSFFLYGLNCFTLEPHAIYEINHQSSIAKAGSGLFKNPLTEIAWRINKLHRSIMRSVYFLKNFRDMTPHEKPKGTLGKSGRIRA